MILDAIGLSEPYLELTTLSPAQPMHLTAVPFANWLISGSFGRKLADELRTILQPPVLFVTLRTFPLVERHKSQ